MTTIGPGTFCSQHTEDMSCRPLFCVADSGRAYRSDVVAASLSYMLQPYGAKVVLVVGDMVRPRLTAYASHSASVRWRVHVACRVFCSVAGQGGGDGGGGVGKSGHVGSRQTAWWLVSEFDAVVPPLPYHRTYRLGLSPPDTYSLHPNARTAEVVYVWKACSTG